MLGTPGVEASAPCPIPGSGSWASYRTPPTPGPPTLLITGHRPGHGEKPAGAAILGRDRWRKGAQKRKRTRWGMGDISERADRLGRGGGGGGGRRQHLIRDTATAHQHPQEQELAGQARAFLQYPPPSPPPHKTFYGTSGLTWATGRPEPARK